MKILLVAVALAVHGVNGAESKLRGIVFRRLDGDDESSFTGTLGLSGGSGPFVKVKGDNPKRWQKLLVDDIDESSYDIPETFLWTTDGDTPLLHSELDSEMCIQAGYGKSVHHGTKLRLNKCDKDNKFQKWDTYIHGSMQLLDDDYSNLCAASQGVTIEPGKDEMIMVDCDRLDSDDCGRGCFSFD
jgi:hypothetical protein